MIPRQTKYINNIILNYNRFKFNQLIISSKKSSLCIVSSQQNINNSNNNNYKIRQFCNNQINNQTNTNTSIEFEISHIGNSQFCKNKYPDDQVPTIVTKEILKEKIENTFDGLKFKKVDYLVKSFSPHVTVSQDNKSFMTGEYFTDAAKIFPIILSKYLFKRYPNITDGYVLSFMAFFSSYVVIANTFQYLNLQNYIKKLKDRLPNYKYEQLYYVTFMSFIGSVYKDQGEGAIEELIIPKFIEYLDTLSHDEFKYLFANYQNYLLKKEIKKQQQQQTGNIGEEGQQQINQYQKGGAQHIKPINVSYQVPLDNINNSAFNYNNNNTWIELSKDFEGTAPTNTVPAWFSTLVLYNCAGHNHFGRLQTLLSQHSKKPGQVHLIKEINKGTRGSIYLHALTIATNNDNINNEQQQQKDDHNLILGYGLGKTLSESRNSSITDSLLRILHDKKKL